MLVAGCVTTASSPADPSETVTIEAEPAPETPAPQPSAVPAAEAAAPPIDSTAATGFDFDSLVAEIRSAAREERELSILPFGVAWTPAQPQEGSGLAIRVLQPRGGKKPVALRGSFAGGTVRFGRLADAWIGLAAIPIGTSGVEVLEISFEFEDGSAYSQQAELHITERVWDQTTLSVAPRYSSPPPEVQDRIARDRRVIRATLDAVSPVWLLDGPFQPPRPIDVTAEYGQERVFNGELQSRHTGLDLRGAVGDPVRSAGRGRVALAGDFYFSGNGVFVDHGLGVYTGYFHLSEILESEGDVVDTGDLVGRAGATGRVTGPHLHWSLWIGGTGQDAGSLLEMDIPTPR